MSNAETPDQSTPDAEVSLVQRTFGVIKAQQLETPEFLLNFLPEAKKFFKKRKISSKQIALVANIGNEKVIESIATAISETEPINAITIFKELDMELKSEVLITNGQVLNMHVYEKVESIHKDEVVKYFVYHYRDFIESLYTKRYVEIDDDFMHNIYCFIDNLEPHMRDGIFDKVNIKLLYLIAVYEIRVYVQIQSEDELEVYNLIRGGHILPNEELKFLCSLQEFSRKKYDELSEALLNPDLEYYRWQYYEGQDYESYKRFMSNEKSESVGSDIMGDMFSNNDDEEE